jgi:hypothetical protein
MKISFDLDDTLILSGKNYRYEDPIKFPYSIFYKERLRRGTIQLCKDLNALGYTVSIYTTSERSIGYIKKFFKLHGIKLEKAINLSLHLKLVQGNRKEIMPSKVPSKFGINLHVDDDKSVMENGIQFGFNVLIVHKDDINWAEKVLNEAKRIIQKRCVLLALYEVSLQELDLAIWGRSSSH